jgi:glycosyltransferase involved in cell wall biosynthesis
MKVLMISGDRRILDPSSEAGKRLALQRGAVERLDVFVWPQVDALLSLYRAARANRYDVVTAQDPFWRGLVGWKCAWFSGAKLNVQVHTDLAHEPFLRRAIARLVLRRADSIRVVSARTAQALLARGFKVPIAVLPVFVDLARFRALTPRPHAGKRMLWVGRFEAEKDPLLAIGVLRACRAQGLDASLTMLGAGSFERQLRREARGLPVDFPGWEDPARYLPETDLALSTSRFESFGAAIVEALAAGVAVVAPEVGIAREAGAIIAPPGGLAATAVAALKEGARGALALALPSAEEWARRWRDSLV